MKTKIVFGLLLLSLVAKKSVSQQTFDFITASSNINGIKAAIDKDGLNGNPEAIILATPLSYQTVSFNHPFAIWYLSNKWHVFNTDQATMPEGVKFRITYWPTHDDNHFVHVATRENVRNGITTIDNPFLNNSPNAQVKVFQSMSSVRGGYWNAYEPELRYNATVKKMVHRQ